MIIQNEIRKYDSFQWLKIFYHFNPNGENGFVNASEAMYCVDNEHKYSILSTINRRYKINGLYEFIIEYPELGTYNRWQQTDNPLEITEDLITRNVSGFNPIETKAVNDNWGGLSRTKDGINGYDLAPSLLNGIPGNHEWYFAIGQYKNVNWTYVDSSGSSLEYRIPSNSLPVSIVSLWLKLHNINLCTSTQSPFFRYVTFVSIYLIY